MANVDFVEIFPDTEELASELIRMSEQVMNIREPLEASLGVIAEGVNRRFDTETDPDGEPWQPWSESYEARVEDWVASGLHTGKILQMSEELRRRAITAFDISGDSVFFMWEDLPEYGPIQNFGGSAGKGSLIPARAFVGIDEEDQFAIESIAEEFLEAVITIEPESVVSYRGGAWRNPTGRFAPKPK